MAREAIASAEQIVWAHARSFVIAHSLWRAFKFPFVLLVVLRGMSAAVVWDVRWRPVLSLAMVAAPEGARAPIRGQARATNQVGVDYGP